MIFDTHAHYDSNGFSADRDEVLSALPAAGVTLVVNPYYAQRHNLHSLAMVSHWLENAYIVPADLWFRENPFRRQELYSWYMVADSMTADSTVRVNRKQELAVVPAHTEGHTMVGVSYLTAPDTAVVAARLKEMAEDHRYDGSFWEAVLYDGDKFRIEARMIPAEQVIEADDRETLYFRRFSEKCTAQLAEMMGVSPAAIARVTPLKNGVINRTYNFECDGAVSSSRGARRARPPRRGGGLPRSARGDGGGSAGGYGSRQRPSHRPVHPPYPHLRSAQRGGRAAVHAAAAPSAQHSAVRAPHSGPVSGVAAAGGTVAAKSLGVYRL